MWEWCGHAPTRGGGGDGKDKGGDHRLKTPIAVAAPTIECGSVGMGRVRGWLHFYLRQECSRLLPGSPVSPPRNHNHPQLEGSTLADGRVKGVSSFGRLGPHGGP